MYKKIQQYIELKKNEGLRIQRPHFIFSAEAPVARPKIKMTHDQAVDFLKKKGYRVEDANGNYNGIERTIIVHEPGEGNVPHLLKLAKDLGQESSIYSNGNDHEMHFHQKDMAGTHVKGQGTKIHDEPPENFYTSTQDGIHFTHNFDFDNAYDINDSIVAKNNEGDMIKSEKLEKAVRSPSKHMGLNRLKRIQQDNNIGAGGKEYSDEEMKSAINERASSNAEKLVKQAGAREREMAAQAEAQARGEGGALPPSSPAAKKAKHSEAIRAVAEKYAKSRGFNMKHPDKTAVVNEERAGKIAQAYHNMKHDPDNHQVQQAYSALIDETSDQFDHIKKETGMKFTKITPDMDVPYKSSKDLFKDMHENNHMFYFPTEQGFGTETKADDNHPMLKQSKHTHSDGTPMVANDVFRIVHDFFGHAKEGNGFGPRGEEHAWHTHRQMYSPTARKALTTETRGQNSWVNFGPHGESNRKDPANTVYADQKAGLLPSWAHEHDEEGNFGKSEDDLTKGIRGDWKQEGYKLHYIKGLHEGKNFAGSVGLNSIMVQGDHNVFATKDGKYAGHASFVNEDRKNLHPIDVQVGRSHRRKGIASSMYGLAQKKTKAIVNPSEIQSGSAQKMWDQQKRTFGKSEESGHTYLEHYSQHTDLKEIDPEHSGSGVDQTQRAAANRQSKFSFYYPHGSTNTEPMVTNRARSKYVVKLGPEHKIFDSEVHGSEIINASKLSSGRVDIDAFTNNLKQAGFHGFKSSPSGIDMVALFHPHPVHSEEKLIKIEDIEMDLMKGSKNVREQKAKVFGTTSQPGAGTQMREKHMDKIKDFASRRYGLEMKPSGGKMDVKTGQRRAKDPKIGVDKPDWRSGQLEAQANPDAMMHELGHLEIMPKGINLKGGQQHMDEQYGHVQRKYGYMKQKRSQGEVQPMAVEQLLRRRAGLPANKSVVPVKSKDAPPRTAVEDESVIGTRVQTGKTREGHAKFGDLIRQSKFLKPEYRELVDKIDRGELVYDPEKGWHMPDPEKNINALINVRAREKAKDPTRKDAKTLMRSEDLAKHEKTNLKKALSSDELHEQGYRFRHLGLTKNPDYYVAAAYHGKTKVGHVFYGKYPDKEGYHDVPRGYVDEKHRGKGIYQNLLKLGSQHVKQINPDSKGLTSKGYQRSTDATYAWDKVATHAERAPKHEEHSNDPRKRADYFIKNENILKRSEEYPKYAKKFSYLVVKPNKK